MAVGLGALALAALVAMFAAGGHLQLALYRRRQLRTVERHYADFVRELGREQRRIEDESRVPGAWGGYRMFRVARKVTESRSVFSYYLEPHDRKPIADFEPGQFLRFRFRTGSGESLVRCYSVSRHGIAHNQYRVTVRWMDATTGKAIGRCTRHLAENVNEGGIVDVAQPSGNFRLRRGRPAVFLAGGIGATPLLAMAQCAAAEHPGQDAWFFYGVRDGSDSPLIDSLRKLSERSPRFNLVVLHSNPGKGERKGTHYTTEGHIRREILEGYLPSVNYEFYVCGPPPMMKDVLECLAQMRVPDESVHREVFSAKTVTHQADSNPVFRDAVERNIRFLDAGKSFTWKPEVGSPLLDQAEASGLSLASGCRTGNCGTCVAAVNSGTFQYVHKPGFQPQAGCCLPCIAVPTSDIEFA